MTRLNYSVPLVPPADTLPAEKLPAIMATTKSKKKKALPWGVFLAERLARYTHAAAHDPNWARWYKIVRPWLKKEIQKAT